MTEILAEYFRMGGYAFYVWTSYAITFAVLGLNWWLPQRRRRAIRRTLAHQARLSRSDAGSDDAPEGSDSEPADGSRKSLSTPGGSSS
ncbi:heme exporter protein CcmD [Thioalkalivibrio sp. HK1]|uniref:heme exporter protein CcmD n=1 Tax=Thioalkalivibrio sp. HK1 TaxID=1469245 RepID=UPI0004712194|nr:heme exporter protein CcmD [Thioalkalivibrio sp. HK1]